MKQTFVPWDDSFQHLSITAGYSRSSIYDENSPAGELKAQFAVETELDNALAKRIHRIFKWAAEHYSKELEIPDEKAHFWRVKLTSEPALGVEKAYRFILQHYTQRKQQREGQNSAAFNYNYVYSLVPIVTLDENGKQALRWYLNIGNNPSQNLTERMRQISGVEHSQLKENSSSREALIFMYTLGYWCLEELSECLMRLSRSKQVRFKWPLQYEQQIKQGEPKLIEVGYSLYSPPMAANCLRDLLFQLQLLYDHSVAYSQNNERSIFHFGRWLNVEYLSTDSRINYKGSALRKVTLLKKYGDTTRKSSITFEPCRLPTSAGGYTIHLKCSVSFFSRFFQSLTQRRDGKQQWSASLTIADYVDHSLEKTSKFTGTAFQRHYRFASQIFNRTIQNDFFLGDVLAFDLSHFAEIVNHWRGSSAVKEKMFNDWWTADCDSSVENDEIQAKKLGISRKTLYNYRRELTDAGVNLQIPLPAYLLLADARRHACEELHEKFSMLAIGSNIPVKVSSEHLLRAAILRDNKIAKKLLGTLSGSHLLQFIPLQATKLIAK